MDITDLVVAMIRTLARARVVQFIAIGIVIFLIAPAAPDDRRISLRASDLEALRAAQAQRLGVSALSDEACAEVDRRAIEDEVLYREALRLGLDRGDRVVRRHLVQKVLLLAEDLAGAAREPTPTEIAGYFERTRDRWHVDEQFHLLHVFAAHRETLVEIDAAVHAAPAGSPPPLGDAFPRSRDVRATRADLATTYGADFADAIAKLAVGTWSGPVESRFGWHLVRVVDRDAGRPANLAEVEDRVRLDYIVERRHQAVAQFLARAFTRYNVEIDGTAVTDYQPTARLARRSEPSAED